MDYVGYLNFFSRLMTIHFEPLIKKKQAITYIEDTIMQSQNKSEMFSIIHEYHNLLRKVGLKAAPEKTFFFLKKLKFLGHVISSDGIQQIAKRVKDLKNIESPECKRDVMKVLGCLGFYSCYIKNLHLDSKPSYDLIGDSTSFHWTEEHEKIFQMIKHRISEDTILAIPSTVYPFHIHVDSLSLFLVCFRMGHYNELGGHMGASKTYANAKRFYYWPGMFDWICALTADCLACQNNKPKPKHLNEVPLEE